MNNYYEKYLKYKAKYLELKEQINNEKKILVGGNNIDYYNKKISILNKILYCVQFNCVRSADAIENVL